VVKELNEVTVGIAKVNRPGTIPVVFGPLSEGDPLPIEQRRPSVDFFRFGEKKAKMVESGVGLIPTGSRRASLVKRQIVGTACQVNTLGIRLPFHIESQDLGIEFDRSIKIPNPESKVTKPQHTSPSNIN
jgi:hypothetical protein